MNYELNENPGFTRMPFRKTYSDYARTMQKWDDFNSTSNGTCIACMIATLPNNVCLVKLGQFWTVCDIMAGRKLVGNHLTMALALLEWYRVYDRERRLTYYEATYPGMKWKLVAGTDDQWQWYPSTNIFILRMKDSTFNAYAQDYYSTFNTFEEAVAYCEDWA